MRVTLRWLLVALVLALALLTWLFLRGPAFWQRNYYPSGVSGGDRRVSRAASGEPVPRCRDHQRRVGLEAATARLRPARWASCRCYLRPPRTSLAGAPSTRGGTRRPNLSDPAVNIEYGTAYVRYLVGRYHEVETVLAAYNAGCATRTSGRARAGTSRPRSSSPRPNTTCYG